MNDLESIFARVYTNLAKRKCKSFSVFKWRYQRVQIRMAANAIKKKDFQPIRAMKRVM